MDGDSTTGAAIGKPALSGAALGAGLGAAVAALWAGVWAITFVALYGMAWSASVMSGSDTGELFGQVLDGWWDWAEGPLTTTGLGVLTLAGLSLVAGTAVGLIAGALRAS